MLKELKFSDFLARDLRMGEKITTGTIGEPVTLYGIVTATKPRDFDFDKIEASIKITQHYELEVGNKLLLKVEKDALKPLISAINHAGAKATDKIDVTTSEFKPGVGVAGAKVTAVAYADFPLGVTQGPGAIEFEGDGKGFVQKFMKKDSSRVSVGPRLDIGAEILKQLNSSVSTKDIKYLDKIDQIQVMNDSAIILIFERVDRKWIRIR